MKRRLVFTVFLVLVSILMVSTALASEGPPVGGCPTGFEPHPFMHHEDHEGHEDHHIGLAQDLNEDGWICVKHLSDELHVHMDNVVQ